MTLLPLCTGDILPANCGRNQKVRLCALVKLQIQPLKRIFMSNHRYFLVQYQFSRTRQTLYSILHIDYLMWDPHVIFSLLCFLSLSLPGPHLPQRHSSLSSTDAPRCLLSSSSSASSFPLRHQPRSLLSAAAYCFHTNGDTSAGTDLSEAAPPAQWLHGEHLRPS
jgi:hypothetical protein